MRVVRTVAYGLIALLAVIAADWGRDLAYSVHALLIAAISFGLFVYELRNSDSVPVAADRAQYLDGPVRAGVIATAFWGVAGFLVGVFIALQLAFPELNFDWSEGYANFGRLRPLHTSAVIFAFGGNALIATSFYVVQRTSAARLWGGNAAWFVFWGYQLFIVMAATGYLLGSTQSKEYAEPEWYVDIWLTIVWLVYLAVYPGHDRQAARAAHLRRQLVLPRLHRHRRDAARGQQHQSIPVSIWGSKSVQVFAGVQDAMTQWWYGHNAVGLLPDGRVPRHDVLLRAEAGEPADLQLQAVDHPLLGADLPLHLGRSAPPALHRAAGLGRDAGHGVLDHAVDAVLGRHDQRPDDAGRRLGQDPHRPDHPDVRGLASPSTACRPSRGR